MNRVVRRNSLVVSLRSVAIISGVFLALVGAVIVRGSDGQTDVPPVPREFAETLTSCEGLEIYFEGERDTLLDLEHELLMMHADDHSDPVTVRYADAACVKHPVVGPLIAHALQSAREDLDEECRTLQAAIDAGSLPTRHGIEVDARRAEAHIARWCPSATENR